MASDPGSGHGLITLGVSNTAAATRAKVKRVFELSVLLTVLQEEGLPEQVSVEG